MGLLVRAVGSGVAIGLFVRGGLELGARELGTSVTACFIGDELGRADGISVLRIITDEGSGVGSCCTGVAVGEIDGYALSSDRIDE